ncbi:MAG: MaoC family dehydratase [Candidatus Lustribacter sp.]|jgi:acyl dehydratase
MARYLEDLKPGQAYESRRHTITQDEIVKFAREFDPQPFHTDPEAAKTSFFGKLIASGWHTAALTMKMLTEADIDIAGGIIGAGMEELRWPVPLVPGDTIHVRVEILDSRASKSRPAIGIVRARIQALREDGMAVQEMIASLIVPAKPA